MVTSSLSYPSAEDPFVEPLLQPYAIRDFSRGLFEVGESSSARDSSHVDGLAPWALRCDLEASRAQARVMEAELGTCQTAIALLKSKNKIGEKERELLNHDLENVKRALGNVLERISVLESGENATLKKILAEGETKLAWARMERDIAERWLHESRVWNKIIYLDMVRIGAVPKPPSNDEDTELPSNVRLDDSWITYTAVVQSIIRLIRHRSPRGDDPEHPLSPDYVLGPEHADDEIVAEDQPGAEDAPPTAQSPDYVPDTDPEADPEEDDDEDPEEDPIDYPADGGDDGDDENGHRGG
ncbi:hypothetical protein Tco_0265806 [Tanacetum coccineum]